VCAELVNQGKLLCSSDVYSFGVMMWEAFHRCTPYAHDNDAGTVHHPYFPTFHPECPLSYALLAVSCLSPKPEDRPTFDEILCVIMDLKAELRQGHYINREGCIQVRADLKQALECSS
jgi:serine/threonine protein kinase